MTNIESLGQMAFDRGIDRITYARKGPDASVLPDREEAAPPDLGTRPQLESLLVRPTLDDSLGDAIRPRIENRDLLTPSRFRQTLDSTLSALKTAAEQMQPPGGRKSALPEEVRVLNRAVRLLSEESGLRDLVQMYRSALYEG